MGVLDAPFRPVKADDFRRFTEGILGLAVCTDSFNARTANGGGGGNRQVTDAVTTLGSPQVTSATAAYVAGDVGKTGTLLGFPAGTIIGTVTNGTTVQMTDSKGVAVNATANGSGLTMNIALQSASYQTFHTWKVMGRDPRLVYNNFAELSGAGGGLNPITVSAAIIVATPGGAIGGQIFPVKFAGASSVTIAANDGYAVLDPVGIVGRPGTTSGLGFWVITYVTVATPGQTWPQTKYLAGATEGFVNGRDYTATLAGMAAAGGYGFCPNAVLATRPPSASTGRRLFVIGDSIDRGEQPIGPFSTTLGFGFQAPLKTMTVHNVAAFGEYAAPPSLYMFRRRAYMASGCTSGWCGYGINDCINTGGLTLATLQANIIDKWTWLSVVLGLPSWARTLTPASNSSDAWATLANQSIDTSKGAQVGNFTAGSAVRIAYNQWLRDGAPMTIATLAPVAVGVSGAGIGRCATYGTTGTIINPASGTAGHPLTGVFDVGGAMESSTDSGLWVVNGTANYSSSDGIHPSGNPGGYPAGGGAINASVFV